FPKLLPTSSGRAYHNLIRDQPPKQNRPTPNKNLPQNPFCFSHKNSDTPLPTWIYRFPPNTSRQTDNNPLERKTQKKIRLPVCHLRNTSPCDIPAMPLLLPLKQNRYPEKKLVFLPFFKLFHRKEIAHWFRRTISQCRPKGTD